MVSLTAEINARRNCSGAPPSPAEAYQTVGVAGRLPVFYEQLKSKLNFPMSWTSGNYHDFREWQKAARQKVLDLLLPAPGDIPFQPQIVAEQDRGHYVARKVAFNLTAESRVLGLTLIPKGLGPFPALLLLHDHGAKFDIGKEKVIEPWDDPEKLAAAQAWTAKYFDGHFIGDRLAARGYAVLAVDALGWGDRGGMEYPDQQGLASNLSHLGTTLAGLMAHEDRRAAAFLATFPEVDPRAIGACGFSMGAYRAWQVAALSDTIKAAVAVCWMATLKGLMVPGNNQTLGHSAFHMVHPGLANFLDYPDIASIAAPKPLLFYNGALDPLFPADSVQEAYAKLRRIWDSQDAAANLETRLWPALEHVFNEAEQDAAFAWLERHL